MTPIASQPTLSLFTALAVAAALLVPPSTHASTAPSSSRISSVDPLSALAISPAQRSAAHDPWLESASATPTPSTAPWTPSVSQDSISVTGSAPVTARGEDGWELSLSASEDANRHVDPAAAEMASLETFALARAYDDGRVVRFGRYQAPHLGAVGRVDGVQGEMALEDNIAAGVMAGFRSHSTSELDANEPVAVAYVRGEFETTDELRYTGSLGLLGTAYEGSADRTAILVEQRATVARKLSLEASSEIDLDAFSDLEQHVAPLTRLRLSGSLPVTSQLSLRAGVRRDRRPDTRAERELYGGTDEEYARGSWTHWAGATARLPYGLEAGSELALRDSAIASSGADANVFLSRHGLPALPQASTRVGVFTRGAGPASTAMRWTTNVSWLDGRVSVQPAATVSLAPPKDATLREDALSFRAQWNPLPAWRVAAGASYRVDGFARDEALVELGYQQLW